jgi:hypothetical protein
MNGVIREVRRRLGRLRHEVMHGRADRQLAQASDAARRGWIAQAATDLPSLPVPVDVSAEVHTLCGEGPFEMGLWASWSLMRFLPPARRVVHSDGSLSAQSCARWAALIPGVRMLERDAGLVRMADHLAAYPKVLEWTRQYHFGFKLGGLHALVEAPRLIDIRWGHEDAPMITLVGSCEASGRTSPSNLSKTSATSDLSLSFKQCMNSRIPSVFFKSQA